VKKKKSQLKQYQVTLTEHHMQVISTACELLARVGIGQIDFLDHLPLKDKYLFPHEEKAQIREIIKNLTISGVDGWASNLGISSDNTDIESKRAWEIHQSFRHRLSWDRAVEQGIIESIESRRKWPEMMGVNFDEPMGLTDEALPQIKEDDK
jgi:hypothetical protein